jgi:hypothetical protein
MDDLKNQAIADDAKQFLPNKDEYQHRPDLGKGR